MKKRILIADDEPHIRDIIDFALQNAGLDTVLVEDGVQAIATFQHDLTDLIILDVGMPNMDGLEVCRTIRKISDCPILFLSARDEEVDRIVGLEIGGDDYVTKPFSPRELVARVNAILKRVGGSKPAIPTSEVFTHGIVTLDKGRHSVGVGGNIVDLTATEFDILCVLITRPSQVYSRTTLLDRAWPENIHVSDRTIDSHVRNLRSKMREAGCQNAVRTVHGVGFQLDTCEANG